jgi:prepilin-type N-terminal cleavage/methylation domain-containing protein
MRSQFSELRSQARGDRRRAFTLIELLTVMAITAVLLTIIVLPIFQSFNLTRAAQAFADAQDKARILTEKISREVGNANSVRDLSGFVTARVNGVNRTVPRHALVVVVPGQDGTDTQVVLPNTKMDLVMPYEGDPTARDADGGYINPDTGKTDPTLTRPKGQVVLPVAGGMTLVRYFLGRRDPLTRYNEPYSGLLGARGGGRDNLYVLFRAEVQVYEYVETSPGQRAKRLFDRDGTLGPDFFSDANNDLVPDDLDDPNFFTLIPGQEDANSAKARRIRNWMRRSVLLTEVSRYDMIQPVFDRRTREVTYDGNVPRLLPLVQFRPSRVSSEPAEGQVAVRLGEETDNPAALAPDVYRTQYGMWSNVIVRTWPTGWANIDNSNQNEYLVGRSDVNGNFGIYAYDKDSSADELNSGTLLFDVTRYQQGATGAFRYPFSSATNAAALNGSARLREIFVPYNILPSTGKIIASFGIDEVGNPNEAPPANNPRNLPTAEAMGTDPAEPAYTPTNDPSVGGSFFDAEHQPVNEKYNKVWNDREPIRELLHRYIDLRVTPQGDGALSPLDPTPATRWTQARIIPGSEEVFGPDQLPGPNYGREVRYTRTTREPGPNQYRINYTDQPEPSDYTLLGLSPTDLVGFNPNSYDRTNFVSAVIQPRFKAGYIQLCSDPNVPVPNPMMDRAGNVLPGQVRVSYRFGFTTARSSGATSTPGDVFAVEYDSRQLMAILLTIRNYPQSSLPNPQSVTLRATATVRNYAR